MLKNELRLKTTLTLTPNAKLYKTGENVILTIRVRVKMNLTVRVIAN